MKSQLQAVACENEAIAASGSYVASDGAAVAIGESLAAARAGTVSYGPDAAVDGQAEGAAGGAAEGPFLGRVAVTAEDSMTAARRLTEAGGGHVAVLNFASGRNPGGGYLRGEPTQEEELCRTALLYACLNDAPDYYAAHRESGDPAYSHRVIWSPHVPVIRDSGRRLLARPYPVSFLTSAAPNAGELAMLSGRWPADTRELLTVRAERVLALAARHGVRELVLGAWGCGVFRNDPEVVAEAFERALAVHGAAFGTVVFAVWDRSPESLNRAAFRARFAAAGD
ncbi:TIGR02452 family protein [Kitasatospora sp. NBC_01266]|uniref:TIGR02452 family protein n=1 Tax=Kitasatospora sp. NBC_01266 TaxID=2903572 RepID=UPI002E2F16B4|nr:TIGR02452 family protein [Kitasatospora sp. NBC_01266]